jgi:hypothetical protein
MSSPNAERTIIKADPGWFVAHLSKDGDDRGISLQPIVAWLIVQEIPGSRTQNLDFCRRQKSSCTTKPSPSPWTAKSITRIASP